MNASLITRDELKSWIDAKGKPFLLIDTALAEYFAEAHLPGALNACVFEVDFTDQVNALLEKATADKPFSAYLIVVYGASENSLASADAAQKLAETGFTNLREYRGGIDDWCAAGFTTEGAQPTPKPATFTDRDLAIDLKESKVEWTGRSLGGKHQGSIPISEGVITVRDGVAVAALFTLEMGGIECTDLTDPKLKKMLESHLKNGDFFDVENHPTSRFVSTSVDPIPGAAQGTPNYMIHGLLQLKGVEKPLAFPAQIGASPKADGAEVALANFDFDRTQWNVLYGSGRFYENLGKHLVSDLVTLDLKIVAR